MNSPARLLVTLLCLACSPLRAEEKNGISLIAAKKTIERADSRSLSYRNIDRTQALKVTIKNTSFRDMPESELVWNFLVKPSYGTTRKKVVGREPVKLLRASETLELLVGNVPIVGYRDSSEVKKTDFDYQLIITQDGKEMIRLESTSNFDTIAKTVTTVEEFDNTVEADPAETRKKKMHAKDAKEEPVEEEVAKEPEPTKEPEAKPPTSVKPAPKPTKEEPEPPSTGVDFFNLNK